MTNNASPAEQYRIVHEGIQAVAARCDGARSLDYQGFDGQDTRYGKRIAGVPFEKLDSNDHVEIARIAMKYRTQILNYTGTDVSKLDVVIAAQGRSTNHASRENARRYERDARDAEKRDRVKNLRRCEMLPDGQVMISWSSGRGASDPDFDGLLAGVRALPGRRWTGTHNSVSPTQALLAFCDEWGIATPAEVIAAVEANEEAGRQQAQAEAEKPQVALDRDGLLVISNKVTEDAGIRAKVMALPGRRWNGQNNVVPASPEAKALFTSLGLRVSDNAKRALSETETLEGQGEGQVTRAALLSQASRAGAATELPAEFLALVAQAVGV